ncbi:MAG TPA: glycosyltransferase [Solirubrobacteraceae bacterium]|nr:glycosyltransferase [Solirubrobacteraceae bacterium]
MGGKPRPTVVFVHSSSGRYGADRQLYSLATGLRRFRAIVVLPGEGELAEDLRAAGVEVRTRRLAVLRRALLSPSGLARIVAAATADAAALSRLARRERAALIHSNTSVTLGGAAAARFARLPHVWHVREIYAEHRRAWPAYRRLLLSADALPCVSAATLAQFEGDRRARLLHDGLPTPSAGRQTRERARRELGLPDDRFVCAIVGRISPWKGQDLLARALAEPAMRELQTIGLVAGDAWPGEEHRERALLELAGRLGVGDRLRLLGFRGDLDTVFGAADVVVVPSTQPDPLPNAALEAAAAGCCVVAADHGGLPEIISDGETGRLVAPGSSGALASALAQLAADPALRARLGEAAARDVTARFSVSALIDGVEALYGELRDRRPPEAAGSR